MLNLQVAELRNSQWLGQLDLPISPTPSIEQSLNAMYQLQSTLASLQIEKMRLEIRAKCRTPEQEFVELAKRMGFSVQDD